MFPIIGEFSHVECNKTQLLIIILAMLRSTENAYILHFFFQIVSLCSTGISLFLTKMNNGRDSAGQQGNQPCPSRFAFPWARSASKNSFTGPIPEAENHGSSILECGPLETDGRGNFVDTKGRKFILKGINVDGALKFPCTPNLPSYAGDSSDPNSIFFDGENVLFVGRPFPLEEAEVHFERIKSWGYNIIRYLITWEALEHAGPCKYDDDFIAYTIEMLKIIDRIGGLYVFMDTHQDAWSRFSGGSGAPLWTFYAAGLQPTRFAPTEAAILLNEARFHREVNPEKYDRMLWTTNYKRLATLVMFTIFFSGENFFPNCKINDENIQSYLQRHYFNSIRYFWKAVVSALPEMLEKGCLLGFELINEPSCGLLGYADIELLPFNQQLRVGTTPTVFQTMKLGMGLPCKVDVYKISITGPQKSGSKVVDPKGKRAWLTPEEAKYYDSKYDWRREPSWIMGECLFAQHGIWAWDDDIDFKELSKLPEFKRLSISDNKCKVIIPDYFSKVHKNHNFKALTVKEINLEYFSNNNFVDFYIEFKKTIRSITPDLFLLIAPPVLEIPPNLREDHRHIIDSKTIYAPHYYDGMSLLFKTWNIKYNVDTLGIMRGRYYNPILGIVFGERAIRACIKKQFAEMRKECEENLGSIPVLMSETGMPFDMDNKKAYSCGKYYSQTAALDAISNALEGLNMSHTYWCYTSINCHKWGDRWNYEDFSFWSPEDRITSDENLDETYSNSNPSMRRSLLVPGNHISSLRSSSRKINESFSKFRRQSLKLSDTVSNNIANITGDKNSSDCNDKNDAENNDHSEKQDIKTKFNTNFAFDKSKDFESLEVQSSHTSTLIDSNSDNIRPRHYHNCYSSPDGVRAVSAVIRPYIIATVGVILQNEFFMKAGKFSLTVRVNKKEKQYKNIPTVIFVPKWHYPYLNYGDIYVTSGTVKYNARLQYLEWFHYDIDSERSVMGNNDTEETIIIKNYSGSLDISSQRGNENTDGGCPIS